MRLIRRDPTKAVVASSFSNTSRSDKCIIPAPYIRIDVKNWIPNATTRTTTASPVPAVVILLCFCYKRKDLVIIGCINRSGAEATNIFMVVSESAHGALSNCFGRIILSVE
jgi:hypothetical protein